MKGDAARLSVPTLPQTEEETLMVCYAATLVVVGWCGLLEFGSGAEGRDQVRLVGAGGGRSLNMSRCRLEAGS